MEQGQKEREWERERCIRTYRQAEQEERFWHNRKMREGEQPMGKAGVGLATIPCSVGCIVPVASMWGSADVSTFLKSLASQDKKAFHHIEWLTTKFKRILNQPMNIKKGLILFAFRFIYTLMANLQLIFLHYAFCTSIVYLAAAMKVCFSLMLHMQQQTFLDCS